MTYNYTSQETLLRPKKVATILNVSVKTVYDWIATGKIEGIKLPGRTLRIRDSDLKKAQKSTLE